MYSSLTRGTEGGLRRHLHAAGDPGRKDDLREKKAEPGWANCAGGSNKKTTPGKCRLSSKGMLRIGGGRVGETRYETARNKPDLCGPKLKSRKLEGGSKAIFLSIWPKGKSREKILSSNPPGSPHLKQGGKIRAGTRATVKRSSSYVKNTCKKRGNLSVSAGKGIMLDSRRPAQINLNGKRQTFGVEGRKDVKLFSFSIT